MLSTTGLITNKQIERQERQGIFRFWRFSLTLCRYNTAESLWRAAGGFADWCGGVSATLLIATPCHIPVLPPSAPLNEEGTHNTYIELQHIERTRLSGHKQTYVFNCHLNSVIRVSLLVSVHSNCMEIYQLNTRYLWSLIIGYLPLFPILSILPRAVRRSSSK